MHRSSNRVAAGLIALAFALALCGCQRVVIYPSCNGETDCSFSIYADGSQTPQCITSMADELGCLPAPILEAHCDFPRICGLTAGTEYRACYACTDPVLVELPDAWRNVSGSWFSGPPFPGDSGVVLIERASNFRLPDGVGPIVTDPGYSAYVMRLDLDTLPLLTYQITIRYNSGRLNSACLKGVEVGMMTLTPGNLRFIAPLGGESLDFTALHAPDPHVFCVGSPVPTLPSTWGGLKAFYR